MAKKPKNDLCDTMAELAARLSHEYSNGNGTSQLQFEISRPLVTKWKHGKRLPIGVPPPPSSVDGNRWSFSAWKEWFEKYLLAKWKRPPNDETQPVETLEALRQKNEREQIEFDSFKRRREMGEFIEVEQAARIGGGMARQLADYWKHRNEGVMVEAFAVYAAELGINPNTVMLLKDWLTREHRKFTDDVEAKAMNAAEKYKDELKK